MKQQLDPFKLTSLDESGSHIGLIPAEVTGFFRRRRNVVQFILLSIFLLLPWVHIDGKQLLWLNISDREFHFFGLLFKAHDAPLLFILIVVMALGLAFATAVWGRIWCGWACPQTVFIEAVYRRIEIWVEGNYLNRRRLQMAPLSVEKAVKKSLKWLLFFLVSALFAHSFVAYFTGSYELLKMMEGSPKDNWNYFLLIVFFTALLTFNFGWFREQFCVIMCPYGRIQSVLLEPSSLAVVYDHSRGEPRRASANQEKTGDCVGCNRCVEVCPTGIDIRNGLQMECIACTACIDSCNEIMAKVKKPQNLISYRTLDGTPLRVWKLKTFFYGFLISLALGVLFYSLRTREAVHIAVLRGIEAPYSKDTDSDGQTQIINHFRLHLTSQTEKDVTYELSLSESDASKGLILTVSQNPVTLKGKTSQTWHVFLRAPMSQLPKNGKEDFTLLIRADDGTLLTRDLIFVGPSQ